MHNEIYDKNYFENGIKTGKSGYENYRWMPDRIYSEIRAVVNLLEIKPRDTVLDFGCAKGYLVKGFRHYGISAFGVDTSEYALRTADKEIKGFLMCEIPDVKYNFIISRNTFEHIEEKELEKLLNKFYKMTDIIFFTVPLAKKDGNYVMQELDITHKIKWTDEQWINFCEKCNWSVEAYYQIKGLHDRWHNYPNAMGFYILRKK